MHGVERRAHLLTVGYLSAEQGAELQEGAQKQRAAGWRGGHGGRAAAGQVRREPLQLSDNAFRVSGRSRVCAEEVRVQLPFQHLSALCRRCLGREGGGVRGEPSTPPAGSSVESGSAAPLLS